MSNTQNIGLRALHILKSAEVINRGGRYVAIPPSGVEAIVEALSVYVMRQRVEDHLSKHRLVKNQLVTFGGAWIYRTGDTVRKKGDKGQWHGAIVGFYSTECTIHGYAVESVYEANSVQIYPESALEPWSPDKIILNREDVK